MQTDVYLCSLFLLLRTYRRRYYYWNTETDLVSWLPPGHPKCRVSASAAQLRKQMLEEREKRLKEEGDEKKESDEEESSDDEKGPKKRRKLSAKEEADRRSSDESSGVSIKYFSKGREDWDLEECLLGFVT